MVSVFMMYIQLACMNGYEVAQFTRTLQMPTITTLAFATGFPRQHPILHLATPPILERGSLSDDAYWTTMSTRSRPSFLVDVRQAMYPFTHISIVRSWVGSTKRQRILYKVDLLPYDSDAVELYGSR